MRSNLPGTQGWRAAGALGEAFEHTKFCRMWLIVISNWAAERSAAFISLSLCYPAGEQDGVCPLTSQGGSEQSLTLKSVKHPVTEAVSATEKPRRKLILMPEASLNKQHHVLDSEQRWTFSWREWASTYPIAPSPTPFPERLSSASVLLSPVCAPRSLRGGVSALHVLRTTVASFKGVFGALGLTQEGLQKVVRCKSVTKPGHCLCFEWQKTGRARNLEKVEDHFGSLLFKSSLMLFFCFLMLEMLLNWMHR